LISKRAKSEFQGLTLGLGQSLSSLARVLGPSTGGFLYGNLGHRTPFMLGALSMGLSFLLAMSVYNRVNSKGENKTG
jgi:MFS family permease